MLVSERYIWADGRVVINNNGPDLINSAGILAIHFYDGVMFTNLRFHVENRGILL